MRKLLSLISIFLAAIVCAQDPFQDATKEAIESAKRTEEWKELLRDKADLDEAAKALVKLENSKKKPKDIHDRDTEEIEEAVRLLKIDKDIPESAGALKTPLKKKTSAWSYIHLQKSSDYSDTGKPAKLSYEYDGDKDIYSFEGGIVIGYFQEMGDEWRASWWIGNDFDISNDKDKSETSITNRIAAIIWKKDGWVSILPSIDHEANRNFKSKALVGTLLVEPAINIGPLKLNQNFDAGNNSWMFGPLLGVEQGSVLDDAETASPERGAFTRGVIKIQLRFYPGFAEKKLTVYIDNTTRFLGDDDWKERNFFSAGLEYEISGNVSISADYEIGRDSSEFEQKRTVKVGLGLSF